MKDLTPRQQEFYDFVKSYLDKNQKTPTIQEIADAFDINPNAVRSHILYLDQKGAIKYTPNIARGIMIPQGRASGVPIYGSVPAGHPFLSDENIVDSFEVRRYLSTSNDVYSVTVRGDSMETVLFQGDLVFVDPRKEPRNGEIVIATVDGQPTIKRYYKSHGEVELHPQNKKYAVITIPKQQEHFSVNGVIVGYIRSLDKKRIDTLYAEQKKPTRN